MGSGLSSSSSQGMDEVQRAFEHFDRDNDGKLTAEELQAVLTDPRGGHALSSEQAAALIRRFDKNKDGVLDYREFTKAHSLLAKMHSQNAMEAKPKPAAVERQSQAKKKPQGMSKQGKQIAQTRMRHEREQAITQQLEDWMQFADANQDQHLDREELKSLLMYVNENWTPDEKAIDFLMLKATEISTYSMKIAGDKNGRISKHAVQETVKRYKDYLAEQAYIDRAFAQFDVDGSGVFEPEELSKLLRQLAPDSAALLDEGVEFILQECDLNADGAIDREELLPLIGNWLAIARRSEAEAAAAAAPADDMPARRTVRK